MYGAQQRYPSTEGFVNAIAGTNDEDRRPADQSDRDPAISRTIATCPAAPVSENSATDRPGVDC